MKLHYRTLIMIISCFSTALSYGKTLLLFNNSTKPVTYRTNLNPTGKEIGHGSGVELNLNELTFLEIKNRGMYSSLNKYIDNLQINATLPQNKNLKPVLSIEPTNNPFSWNIGWDWIPDTYKAIRLYNNTEGPVPLLFIRPDGSDIPYGHINPNNYITIWQSSSPDYKKIIALVPEIGITNTLSVANDCLNNLGHYTSGEHIRTIIINSDGRLTIESIDNN